MEKSIDPADIVVRAAAVGLVIPAECIAGVANNLQVLQRFIGLIDTFPLEPECDPAPEYRP